MLLCSCQLLDFWIPPSLKVTTHADEVLASCAGSLYALRVLRAHGLDEHSLRTVCKATTLNRILYACPAWWGYADEADRTTLHSQLRMIITLSQGPYMQNLKHNL